MTPELERIWEHWRTFVKEGIKHMQNDRVITISLDTTQCNDASCAGIVFNIVEIDGVKFSRCVNCGKFTLLTFLAAPR